MIIGISGGSGSGKTTIVNQILAHFSSSEVTLLSQDSYYHAHDHLPLNERKKLNFDHPDAIEWELMISHLTALKNGEEVMQPVYSMVESNRTQQVELTKPAPIIIVEGILIYTQEALRDICDKRYWVDVPLDIRLWRIVNRDTNERGKTLELTLQRYKDTVKPMHVKYIDPCIEHANEILQNDEFSTLPNADHVIDMMNEFLNKK
jgi:uridine kinase